MKRICAFHSYMIFFETFYYPNVDYQMFHFLSSVTYLVDGVTIRD